jgi:hypothetical protein
MKNENRYALKCLAPDGDFVREGEFPTVDAAWDRSSDMGSRWIFYPLHIVTGTARTDAARIADVPHGMPEQWKGRAVRSLVRAMKAEPQAVIDYLEGRAPLCLFP